MSRTPVILEDLESALGRQVVTLGRTFMPKGEAEERMGQMEDALGRQEREIQRLATEVSHLQGMVFDLCAWVVEGIEFLDRPPSSPKEKRERDIEQLREGSRLYHFITRFELPFGIIKKFISFRRGGILIFRDAAVAQTFLDCFEEETAGFGI
uniref:Uncharacterized protein n=1 Tax=Chromera velia CCMP2878 TaxID=1169474 RepID=A0A0G4I6N3_9ALVE|eukprot:Cvel_11371.t1-p1 / transcript=Cvel_11371.t1 / gene=Cvel_11371 / organism=Chromera_velia_CCMP2878 / gene_product=hypothetical protein / transcript_product=hypothetical protein / location=Cvel_scaffold713:5564-6019(+) / protein_length=152 / sequence_SO=supercontig / SO=protein_coding / is_pseudo=false